MDLMSRHGTDVATWPVGKRSCDMKLMSRHRGVSRRVATWFWCVATWLGARQEKQCRDTDLMSRHDSGCLDVATSK